MKTTEYLLRRFTPFFILFGRSLSVSWLNFLPENWIRPSILTQSKYLNRSNEFISYSRAGGGGGCAVLSVYPSLLNGQSNETGITF
jgi:hypothetical protein